MNLFFTTGAANTVPDLGPSRRFFVMNKKRNRLKRVVSRLVKAELNYSWRGGGDPANKPAIETERKRARAAYNQILNELFPEDRVTPPIKE